jgi:hypothetical protein
VIVEQAIESVGIPTILIAALPPVAKQQGASRAVAPDVPMGASVGEPHNVNMQRNILRDTLVALKSIKKAGEIIPLPYRYRWGEFSQL